MYCTLDIEIPLQTIQQEAAEIEVLLAKAAGETIEASLMQVVFSQFGLFSNAKSKQNNTPAAIAAQVDGVEIGSGACLYASPAYLILQRDSFLMHPDVPIKLSQQAAQCYIARLNKHFERDGIVFFLGRSGQWYLNFTGNPMQSAMQTYPLAQVAGHDIGRFSPHGTSTPFWQQKLNEIQMLLFEDEENIRRESAGELPVNSVWLDGVEMPVKPVDVTETVDWVVSEQALYKGLAQISGAKWLGLPAEVNASTIEQTLSLLSGAVRIGLKHDDALLPWLNTLVDLLKQGKIKQLKLQFGIKSQVKRFTLKQHDVWLFWRRKQAIF